MGDIAYFTALSECVWTEKRNEGADDVCRFSTVGASAAAETKLMVARRTRRHNKRTV